MNERTTFHGVDLFCVVAIRPRSCWSVTIHGASFEHLLRCFLFVLNPCISLKTLLQMSCVVLINNNSMCTQNWVDTKSRFSSDFAFVNPWDSYQFVHTKWPIQTPFSTIIQGGTPRSKIAVICCCSSPQKLWQCDFRLTSYQFIRLKLQLGVRK